METWILRGNLGPFRQKLLENWHSNKWILSGKKFPMFPTDNRSF